MAVSGHYWARTGRYAAMKKLCVVVVVVGCSSNAPNDHQIHRSDTADRTRLEGREIDLSKQSFDWLPLPATGTFNIDVDVKAPVKGGVRDYAHANGHIVFHCKACRLGDDKTNIPLSGDLGKLAPDGIAFSHLDFDRIDVEVDIVDGRVTINQASVDSKDVAFLATGGAKLATALDDSIVDACLRFKASPDLVKRDPKLDAVISTTGAPQAPDGFFNIKLADRFGSMKRLGTVCDGSVPAAATQLARPQLPDEPPVDPTPAPASAPAPEPAAAVDDPEVEKAIAKGITKKSETSFEVTEDVIDKIVENPLAIGKGARVVPTVANGKPIGFKLYAIRPDSFYDRAGFLNGDTILAVAGISVESADRALEAYTRVRDTKVGETLAVEITRKGKPLTLSYTLR